MRPCVINPIPQKSTNKNIPPRPTRSEKLVPFKEAAGQDMAMSLSIIQNSATNGTQYPAAPAAEIVWKVDSTQSLELVAVEVSLSTLRDVFNSSAALTEKAIASGKVSATAAAIQASLPQFASLCLTVTPEVQYTSYDSYAAVPYSVIVGRFDKDTILNATTAATTSTKLVQQHFEGPVRVALTVKVHNCVYELDGYADILGRAGPLMGNATVRITEGDMPKATQWRPIIYRRWFEVKDIPNAMSNNGGGEAANANGTSMPHEATVSFPPTNPFYREHREKQAHARLKRLAGAAAAAGAAEAAAEVADNDAEEEGGLLPLTKAEKRKQKANLKGTKKGAKVVSTVAEVEETPEVVPTPAATTPSPQPPSSSTAGKFRLLAGAVAEARAVSTCGRFVRWARPSSLMKSQEANYLPASDEPLHNTQQEPASTITAAGRVVVHDTPSSAPVFAPIDYEAIGGGETPMHQVKMYTRRLTAPTHKEAALLHTDTPLDCRSVFLYPHTASTRLPSLEGGASREAIALFPCGHHLFVLWADPANDSQLTKMHHKSAVMKPIPPVTMNWSDTGVSLIASHYFTTSPAESNSTSNTSTRKGKRSSRTSAAVAEVNDNDGDDAPDLVPVDAPCDQDPHWICGADGLGRGWSIVATVGWQPASTASVGVLGDTTHTSTTEQTTTASPTEAADSATTTPTLPRIEGESSETIITSKPLSAAQSSSINSVTVSMTTCSPSTPPPQLVEYYIGQRLHRTIAFFAPSSLLINEPTIALRSEWPSNIGYSASIAPKKTKKVAIPSFGSMQVGASETATSKNEIVHLNQVGAFLKACQDVHEHDPRDNSHRRFRFFRGAVKDVMIPRTDIPTATKDEWSSRRLMDWNEVRAAVAIHVGSVRSTGFDLEAHQASMDKSSSDSKDGSGRPSTEEDDGQAVTSPTSTSGSNHRRESSPLPRAGATATSSTSEGGAGELEKAVVFVQWADGTFSCASSPAGLHLVEVNPVRPEDVQFVSPMPLTPEDLDLVDDHVDALHAAVRTDKTGILRTPLMVRRSTSPDVIDVSVQESIRNRKKEDAKKRRDLKKGIPEGGKGKGGKKGSKQPHRRGRDDEDEEDDYGSFEDEEEEDYSDDEDHHHHYGGRDDDDDDDYDDSDVSSTFSMRREREAEKGGIIDGFMIPASLREQMRNGSIPLSELPRINVEGGADGGKDGGKSKKHASSRHHHHHAEEDEDWESEGDDNDAYDYGGSSTGDYDSFESYDDDDSAGGIEEQSWGDEEGEEEEGSELVGSSAFDTEYDYDSGYNSSDMYDEDDTNELKNYQDGQLSDEAYSYEEGWSTESGESEGGNAAADAAKIGTKRQRGGSIPDKKKATASAKKVSSTKPPSSAGGAKKKSSGTPPSPPSPKKKGSAATKEPVSVRGRKVEATSPKKKTPPPAPTPTKKAPKKVNAAAAAASSSPSSPPSSSANKKSKDSPVNTKKPSTKKGGKK